MTADLEKEARALLAAEFEAGELHQIAKHIREIGDSQGWATNADGVITRALRAIKAALARPLNVAGEEGVERD